MLSNDRVIIHFLFDPQRHVWHSVVSASVQSIWCVHGASNSLSFLGETVIYVVLGDADNHSVQSFEYEDVLQITVEPVF